MEKDKDFESPGGTAEKNCEFQRTTPMKLSSCSTTEWRSVTKDSFPPHENIQVQGIGKRKMLIKKYFVLQAAKDILKEEIDDPPIADSCYTEYIDNFCNPDFKPFVENTDYDIKKQMKYPLYGGVNLSIYKQLVDDGQLKERSTVANFNQPFRRSCSFTTPLELSIREVNYY